MNTSRVVVTDRFSNEIQVGDYVEVIYCRKYTDLIHQPAKVIAIPYVVKWRVYVVIVDTVKYGKVKLSNNSVKKLYRKVGEAV